MTISNLLPSKVLKENISPLEVAKYYLKIEFSKLFPDAAFDAIEKGINRLKEKDIFPLLEGMSFTYHLNGVFYNITREGYTWNEEIWDIDKLILTDMNPSVNKIIYSENINGESLKFKKYLLDYFENNKDSDPENLFSYKPTTRKIYFPNLILKEKEGKILMLDGSHRLIEMLLNDVQEVRAFVGHPVNSKPDELRKVQMSGSTFIMLTICYKNGNAQEREAVITLAQQLIKRTLNGRDEIQKYWIDRQRDPEIIQAGHLILTA